MVDMELVQGEMARLEIKDYRPFSPSIRNLEKLFRKYEVEELTLLFYDNETYGENQCRNLNWCDPFFEHQWGQTQLDVDRMAWSVVRLMRKYSREKRWYISDLIGKPGIYIYGRDIPTVDFCDHWVSFRPRRKGLHMKWCRRDEETEE